MTSSELCPYRIASWEKQGLVKQLADRAVRWHRASHFLYLCSTRLTIRQAQVDKLYASLKELAGERRERLQEHLRLCQLRRELDDLEQWIQEREVVAASHELGQDYEHVTVSACISAPGTIRARRETKVLAQAE